LLRIRKKGAILSARKRLTKATRSWRLQTLLVFLSSLSYKALYPHEIKLVEASIKIRFIKTVSKRMIGDKAYDSDPVDQRLLKEHGTELIALKKANRKRPKAQNRNLLNRYKRRWKVERFFAWL
jgi:hypothetical protein